MNSFDQEIRYRLLKMLSQEPNIAQRDMAKKMGVSLGKVNYCLAELTKKGLIKVHRFKSAKNKVPYTYMLTPRGLEEKGKLTVSFLRRKLSEYNEIRRQIRELAGEIGAEGLKDLSNVEMMDAVTRFN